jgi:hypothetical protein
MKTKNQESVSNQPSIDGARDAWASNFFKKGLEKLNECDHITAYRLFSESADRNFLSKYNLALLYRDGNGCPRNIEKSIEILKSIVHEIPNAAIRLAELYYNGAPGVPKDCQNCLAMLFICSGYYDDERKELIEKVQSECSEEQIINAERIAAKLTEKNKPRYRWLEYNADIDYGTCSLELVDAIDLFNSTL